ncbi:uncharacterized protein LOC144909423 [Branchiostoma floridae x Branchiostoma belcheri]
MTTVPFNQSDTSQDRELAEMLQQIYDNEEALDYVSSDDADTSRVTYCSNEDMSYQQSMLRALKAGFGKKSLCLVSWIQTWGHMSTSCVTNIKRNIRLLSKRQ